MKVGHRTVPAEVIQVQRQIHRNHHFSLVNSN